MFLVFLVSLLFTLFLAFAVPLVFLVFPVFHVFPLRKATMSSPEDRRETEIVHVDRGNEADISPPPGHAFPIVGIGASAGGYHHAGIMRSSNVLYLISSGSTN